jgi:hypothetical protein
LRAFKSARLLALAAALAACGGASSVSPSLGSSSPTASPAPTTRPSATAMTSARGFIVVSTPLANTRLVSPTTISGEASVFEATLQWRIVDAGGTVIAQGVTTASAGAPARGTFTISATFLGPAPDVVGMVEVFERGPRDGGIDEIVRVPVIIGR